MRVLLVAQTYFPYVGGGGRPVKVRAIADGLLARGHSVTVLTADLGRMEPGAIGDDFAIRHSPLGRRAAHRGVDVLYLRTALEYRFVTVNPTLVTFCREELPSYDIVHIFGIYDLIGAVIAGWCRRYRIPYVLEPIGMFRPVSRSLLPKRIYHRLIGSRLVHGAARVVATSDQERGEIVGGGVPADRVIIRRNGVAGPTVSPVRGRFRVRLGIPDDARLVLFLGRLVKKKGPDLLLRAFARATRAPAPDGRPWHLALVGPAERDDFRAELDALVRESAIAERVSFPGPVHGEEKWEAFVDSDLHVLPSINENFGNTVAESMAAGTPVIVTTSCGVSEWVVDGEVAAGIVIPYDERALADALLRFAADPAQVRRFREATRPLSARLGWEEPIAATEAMYRDLVGPERLAAGASLATSTADSFET